MVFIYDTQGVMQVLHQIFPDIKRYSLHHRAFKAYYGKKHMGKGGQLQTFETHFQLAFIREDSFQQICQQSIIGNLKGRG